MLSLSQIKFLKNLKFPLYCLPGFFPLAIYLEFKRNTYPEMPEPTVLSLLWK
uniref:Translocase of outer membrane 7 kDa subunit homolog n=1 Tax=Ailuropoda melanoleuca TaxID=9646 RepID=A0A7N5K7Z2_AILME